jgi:SAM-dependent methyltransferase
MILLPPPRYLLAALGLKMFGVNRASRTLYRRIGNTIGQSRRQRLDASYVDRGNWLLQNVRRLGVADLPQPRLLELGTGWIHFYSLYLRLFFDFRGTLYDVWDNRQLHALKRIFSQLGAMLGPTPPGAARARPEMIGKLALIERAEHFEDLYRAFDLEYIIDPNGSLKTLPDASYDVVFSMDVLEHVKADRLESSLAEYSRVLKPGGYSIHQIGVDDHLAHYCPTASRKQYLAYPDTTWRLLFENEVQYFNRVSYDEFVALFVQAGFEAVSVEVLREAAALQSITISAQHRGQSAESLEATRLYMIHRKPL